MLEKTVETYLVDRVRAAGGDAYKFSSPARVSVPDRIVIFPPARIYFVELKRPGGVVTKGQLREHERLRALGCDVRVIDSREAVDAFVREVGALRADAVTEQILAAAIDCIRHDVSPDWQRSALRSRLNAILAASPVEQHEAAPTAATVSGVSITVTFVRDAEGRTRISHWSPGQAHIPSGTYVLGTPRAVAATLAATVDRLESALHEAAARIRALKAGSDRTIGFAPAHGAPDFDAVRDKRMSELTPAQQDDAHELWLREQIGWFNPDVQRHLQLLLDRLDVARRRGAA
ncbi:VRR-NUC domain-containing protein [Burkholderia cenocepacia]|nr:VRR-NUC domain-containing protein [Burkholderia cenocepacia]